MFDVLQDVRYNERHHPICARLFGGDIDEPIAKEVLDIEQVRGRRCEDSDVSCPTQPLISLRAIRWHVQEVPAGTPNHVAVELVEQLV